MKKTLIIVTLAMLTSVLIGCKTSALAYKEFKLTDRRFIFDTKAKIKAEIDLTAGKINVDLDATSNPSTDLVKGVTEAAVNAAIKSAVGK